MIDLYTGTPRSGKSLHAAERIVMRSRFGEPVIGNFPCKLDRYKKANYTYVPNHKLTPKFLIEFSQKYFQDKPLKEGAILLVIDECQLLFNARDWQKKGREGWLRYDILLIAQIDRMIDRQIRGLVEYEYVHRKLSNYGWRGILLRCVSFGAGFIAVKIWYPMNEKVGQELFRARKKYYSIYDTFALFDEKDTGEIVYSGEIVENSTKKVLVPKPQNKSVILLRSFYLVINDNTGPFMDVGSCPLFCTSVTKRLFGFFLCFCCVGDFMEVFPLDFFWLIRSFRRFSYRKQRFLKRLYYGITDLLMIVGGSVILFGIWRFFFLA